jgi:hypothetical protein
LELKNYVNVQGRPVPRFNPNDVFTLVEGGAWQNGLLYPMQEDEWQSLRRRVDAMSAVTQQIPKVEGEVKPGDNHANYWQQAIDRVREVVNARYPLTPKPEYHTYLVWFCKTLQNWKALVGTTLEDGMYYEVTHDGHKKVTYVDIYHKVDQSVIYD